ncbi:DUF2589 domain-containing protein [Candidatus Magnetomoraceae bacterium gMMP-15]
MAEIDTGLIGAVINALPLDKMIAAPLNAMIGAQIQASKAYVDFIMSVGIKDGKAVNIQFSYDETQSDSKGNYLGVVKKNMVIPLLAAITHPNICIEEGTVDFDLTVTQAVDTAKSTEASGGFQAKFGWGPFSVSVHGSVSHKSSETRHTDTRAKYTIHTQIKRQPPPEALMRVIDFLTDAATKPVVLKNDEKPTSTDKLPEDATYKGDNEKGKKDDDKSHG